MKLFFSKISKFFSSLKLAQMRAWVYVLSGLFLLALIAGSYAGFVVAKKFQHLTASTTLLQTDLADAKQVIAALASGNAQLAMSLSDEQTKRKEAEKTSEESAEAFQKRISSLQGDFTKQKENAEATDITTIIKNWSPRIARMVCTFQIGGDTSELQGSATLSMSNGVPRFITNKHVVSSEGVTASSCTAFLPEFDKTLDLTDLTIDKTKDLAYSEFTDISKIPTSILGEIKKCSAKPVVGDTVVVLGYPRVGSKKSITATEGIISGFDDGYYVSSVKIEQGNSGGAAILVKDNCYLGIPTLVIQGKIDSLARILPL